MEMPSTIPLPEEDVTNRLRPFRPLLWWLLFVLVLFGIRAHQRLNARTYIMFTVICDDPFLIDFPSSRLDGQPVSSGAHVSIGWHTFEVSQPKTEPFVINRFFWYGGNYFNIHLK